MHTRQLLDQGPKIYHASTNLPIRGPTSMYLPTCSLTLRTSPPIVVQHAWSIQLRTFPLVEILKYEHGTCEPPRSYPHKSITNMNLSAHLIAFQHKSWTYLLVTKSNIFWSIFNISITCIISPHTSKNNNKYPIHQLYTHTHTHTNTHTHTHTHIYIYIYIYIYTFTIETMLTLEFIQELIIFIVALK